ITLAPRATTVIELKLTSKGIPYWDRPDLGIGKDDVVIQDRKVTVTVHSLGAVEAPATRLALMDANGKVIATVTVPALKAPLDLMPKTTRVTLTIPVGASMKGGSVVVDPDATMREITRVNNQVKLN
ncbi:MAG TPA: CARDB domain-containing protein, partial [Pyrinomonadaceae bacterium]|nr:CARDB domain-containing protein [Pyrinomonadaceae bacterium]